MLDAGMTCLVLVLSEDINFICPVYAESQRVRSLLMKMKNDNLLHAEVTVAVE